MSDNDREETDAENSALGPQSPAQPIPIGGFSQASTSNRRQFLQLATPIYAAVVSTLMLGVGVINWREKEREALEADSRRRAEQRAMISSLLFGDDRADQYYVPGMDNPYSGIKGITPHVNVAYTSIISKLGFTEDRLQQISDLRTPRVDGSLLLLGGPVPNVFTKWIMGIGRGSPVLGRNSRNAYELPISFRNIFPHTPVVGERPKYEIVIEGRSLPDVNEQDYLVLTSIPNVFSNGYGVFNHRIFIAAGLHGPGMRAAHLLLNDPIALEEIFREARDYHRPDLGWQALVHVGKVDAATSMPHEIRGLAFRPIKGLNFDAVRKKFENKPLKIDIEHPLTRI